MGTLLITVIMNFLAFPYQTILPVFTHDILHKGGHSNLAYWARAMVLARFLAFTRSCVFALAPQPRLDIFHWLDFSSASRCLFLPLARPGLVRSLCSARRLPFHSLFFFSYLLVWDMRFSA